MASISNDRDGSRRLLFVMPDGTRKSIRLGAIPKKLANDVKAKVEALVSAKALGLSIDNETAAWVAKISPELHDKLATVGLLVPRQSVTLGEFLDKFLRE